MDMAFLMEEAGKERVKEVGYWVINSNHYPVTIGAQEWGKCGGGDDGNDKEGDPAVGS